MKANQPISPETQYIEPFSIERALIGLELSGTDDAILNYLNFIRNVIPTKQMYFLHYLETLRAFEALYDENYLELLEHDAITQATKKELQQKVNQAFGDHALRGYIVDALMGNPLEELLEKSRMMEADLIVVGQKTQPGSHSILAKRFVRKVSCNALLIPDEAPPKLTRILVPIDYSPLSIKAIQTAIAINKQLKEPVPITCINIFEIPPINWYRIQRTDEQMKTMLKKDREMAFAALKKKHFPIHGNNIQIELIHKENYGAGRYIMDFATKFNYDLIIMGAKGHSSFERLFLGSVTERVVALTKSIPVLVVR